MKNKFKVGDNVVCLKYGKNNDEVFADRAYIVSEVDPDGMIKLKNHKDWWSPERFKLIPEFKKFI